MGPLEDKVLITTEHSIQPHDFFLFEELEKNKFKIKKMTELGVHVVTWECETWVVTHALWH